jgi:hypothetical protein
MLSLKQGRHSFEALNTTAGSAERVRHSASFVRVQKREERKDQNRDSTDIHHKTDSGNTEPEA